MRWSWPAFGCGVLFGAIVAATLFTGAGDGDDGDRRTAPPGSVAPSADAPAATVVVPPPGAREPAPAPSAGGTDAPPADPGLAPAAGRGRAQRPAPGAPPTVVFQRDGVVQVEPRFVLEFENEDDWIAGADVWRPLSAALKAADLALAQGTDADPDALVRRSGGADVLLGIGLAVKGSRADLLIPLAQEVGESPVRRAALAGLASIAPDDAKTTAAVRAAWDDGAVSLRELVLELLPQLPPDTAAALASDALRQGERSPAALDKLAKRVVRGSDAATAIRTAPDLACALAFAVALRGEQGWADRYIESTEGDAICDALLPWLRGNELPERRAEAAVFFPEARRWSRVATLLADPTVCAAARAGVARQSLEIEANRALYARGVAMYLSDPSVPPQWLADVLARLDAAALADPLLRAAVVSLAEKATSAWVREAARTALQAEKPGDAGTLTIVSASYGEGDTWIDVTASLRALVTAGRLSVTASNEIQGDPRVGVAKTLRVEYVYRGRRFETAVREGQALSVP